MFHLIVATNEAGGIGMNNSIPWKCKEDMKHFKQTTLHSIVIMGRKTFESIGEVPLNNRINVVVTRDVQFKADGCIIANTIEQAIKWCEENAGTKKCFVIGGKMIYDWFFENPKYVKTIYHSIIHSKKICDTFVSIPLSLHCHVLHFMPDNEQSSTGSLS